MTLYEVHRDRFEAIAETSFRAEGLSERGDLQRLLRDQVELVVPDALVLAEEYSDWEDSRRRVDLLAIDKQARLVVVELKTEDNGGHLELQALRYAAMVSKLTLEQAVDAHERYMSDRGIAGDARSRILQFLGWTEARPDAFDEDVRIVLVAPDFSKEVTTTVLWLNEYDLDIQCVRVKAYKHDSRILADVQRIIPLPEAEEYRVRVRRKASEQRDARRAGPTLEQAWHEFEAQRPQEEVGVARAVANWAESEGMEVQASSNGLAIGYWHDRSFSFFFKLRHDGGVAVQFQYLRSKPPFSDAARREELRVRLCAIAGVEMPPERIGGKPMFPLTRLVPPSGREAFQGVWLWARDQIRATEAASNAMP